jgi:hypothetical protein
MKSPFTSSIKSPWIVAGVFALGLTASGGLERAATLFEHTAHAQPAGQLKAGGCTIGMLHGKWGYSYSGEIPGVGSLGGVGVETCDANGQCSGTDLGAVEGSALPLSFNGTFTINSECMGTGVLHYSDGEVVTTAFVLVDDGDEFRFTSTDPGATLNGSAKRR